MAAFRLLARLALVSPCEVGVTVTGVPDGDLEPVVRHDVVNTLAEAEARRDYLVMSLATQLRAEGHELVELVE